MNVKERIDIYINTRKSIIDKANKELKELDESYRSEIAKYVPVKIGDIIEYVKSDRWNKKSTTRGIISKIEIDTSGGYAVYIHPTKLNGNFSKRETYYNSFAIYTKCDIKVVGHDDNFINYESSLL